jgi:hypothetical protein
MRTGFALAIGLLACAFVAQAQPRAVQFTEREIDVMRAYFAPQAESAKGKGKGKPRKEKPLPPGMQKKLGRDGGMPEGLQKRFDRGDSLPPGLAKRPLPPDLEKRLPRLPAGYARYLVGSDVVLVDKRRELVMDVVFNVVI